jgi:hypothetical protein
LRQSLLGGGLVAPIYIRWLTTFLNNVDRFFGDAQMGNSTVFTRAFGLKTPAPLWTALAFDRCLLLALVYPVTTVFIMWAASGHVGPAEVALGLEPDRGGLARSLSVAAVALMMFASWRLGRAHGLEIAVYLNSIYLCAFAHAGYVGTASVIVFLYSTVVQLSNTRVAIKVTGVIAVILVGVSILVTVMIEFARSVVGILILVPLFLVVFFPMSFAMFADLFPLEPIQPRVLAIFRSGAVQMVFVAVGIVACLCAARFGAVYLHAGGMSLLLFMGLLTLLNAPFDWTSLGLTRALLRRGLELEGWWPLVLGIVDALFAALVITLLALTMVIGVQAFDDLAAHGGGERILPLGPLFEGVTSDPTAPEYWWIYGLLLSTMIPSMINLMIGGASLMRGVPGVPSLLLRFMPANRAVPTFDRAWIALVLTLQIIGGAILGVVAQILLVVAVLGYVMPWMGLELIDMARALAACDLPGKLIEAL